MTGAALQSTVTSLVGMLRPWRADGAPARTAGAADLEALERADLALSFLAEVAFALGPASRDF